MKQYQTFILFIVIASFLGCQKESVNYQQLEKIDTLLHQEYYDSAYELIKQVNVTSLKSEKDSAYYYMLLTWGRFAKYLKYTPESHIEKSILYYKKKDDKIKLSLSYIIKGGAIYEDGEVENAVYCLKESEQLLRKLNSPFLEYKLFGELTTINCQESRYFLALKYAQKRLKASKISRREEWIANSLNQLAVCYYGMHQIDSACFYINQCIPYVSILNKKGREIILNNIGFLNMHQNPSIASKYLLLAAKKSPTVDTYDNLARLYARQGKEQQADSLWKKALKESNLKQRITILEAILHHKANTGKGENVTGPIKSQLLILKDSLSKHQEKNNIEKQQYEFDHQTAQQEKDFSISLLWKGAVFLCGTLLALSILTVHIRRKGKRTEISLMDKNNKMVSLQKEMEESLKSKDHKIENLQKKIEKQRKEIQKSANSHVSKGFMLYEDIKKGQHIRQWTKEDFFDFFACYQLMKPAFMETLIQSDLKQSPALILYCILQEEGWDKERIVACMGITVNTLRSYKHRAKKAGITFMLSR